MCGRYTLTKPDELKTRFNLATAPTLRPNYNVAPTQTMPVITLGSTGPQVEEMKWGIPRFIGPGKTRDVFNTRSDKAFGSWKKLVSTQRLLVPATGFYEWKQMADGKHPFMIHPKQQELFAFAGIWGLWKDENGKEFKTYSIITTEPNKEMSGIHNRMPVILHQEDEATWLASASDNDRGVIETLLRPYEDNGLEIYEVSRDVNAARVNEEYLVYPLSTQ